MSTGDNQGSSLNNVQGNATPTNAVDMGTMRAILATSTRLTAAAAARQPESVAEGTATNNSRLETSGSGRRVDAQALKFFFEAIDKITGIRGTYDNDIVVVKNGLEELQSFPDDVDRCSVALDNIMSLVDHLDVATDFTKLGGFSIVGPFLKSENSDIVRLAAEVIGIATQNHPRCQETVLADENILSSLFDILKSPERHDNVKLKAVFAISSIIQNNRTGLDEFVKVNGFKVFINLLKVGSIPLRLRTCFVIDCLCSQFPQIKSSLLENDYIGCLVDLLTKVPLEESKETVLSALLSLVEGCYDAIEECKKEEYNLIATLDYLIAHYKDNAEEEKQKAIKLKAELNRFSG